nr:unnamed protein product [Spirometra erinaceieuropaei]
MDHLTALFQEMWRQGQIPQDFRNPTVVHLYKQKGSRQLCDNHRGLPLLSIAGNIFARILLNRLNKNLEQGLLPEGRYGFRRIRVTTDMIFAAHQLQENCQEMRTRLFSTFMNLMKAYDTVNREGLWKLCRNSIIPSDSLRLWASSTMARATDERAVAEALALTKGVRQGCVLAPKLFSLTFFAMPMDAYRDEHPGIRIVYRMDGHLFNHRRVYFQSRVCTTTVHELLFVDDCAPNTTSEEDMRRSMDLFAAASENCGLITNREDLARDRSTRRRTVKIYGAICEANRITASKAKHETCKSQPPLQPPPPPYNANAQPPPTSPRCQRTFRTPSGFVEHFRTNSGTRTATTVVSPSTSPLSPTPSTNVECPPELPLPSSSTASTSAFVASAMQINTTHNPDAAKNANITIDTSGEDLDYTCPTCDRTSTSHLDLVGHFRIHRAETGEPVPGAPAFTYRTRFHCPHCPHTFMRRMGLLGHMRIHENLR